MPDSIQLTASDIDAIAFSLAFYCVVFSFGACLIWDFCSYVLSRFFERKD